MALRFVWPRIRREKNRIGRLAFQFFAAATWIPVVILFNDNVGELTHINGPSMYPFLNAEKDQTTRKDVVFTFKYNAQYDLERGMIVVFRNPENPDVQTVKRIIGLPGDLVTTRNPDPAPTVRVPPGHVWVEGDAGERDSLDSNNYGPISAGLVIGKVTHIVWPPHRATKVRWREYAEKIRSE